MTLPLTKVSPWRCLADTESINVLWRPLADTESTNVLWRCLADTESINVLTPTCMNPTYNQTLLTTDYMGQVPIIFLTSLNFNMYNIVWFSFKGSIVL